MSAVIEVLVYTIGVFFSEITSVVCYGKLNNMKLKINTYNILIIFISTIISTINIYFNPITMKAIFNFVIICLEIKLIFKNNIKIISICYLVIQILIFLIEILLTNILLVFGILTNNTSVNTTTYINFILTIMVSLLLYMIISCKPIKKYFQKSINFLQNITYKDYIFYIIFFTIYIIGMLNIRNFANENSIQLILILFLIFLLLFVSIIKLRYKEKDLKMSNQKLIDYNDNYGKFLDEYKIYKHNIKNKLTAMKVFGNKKINNLIDELLEEETTFTIKNNNLYNVPNGIKGIVAEKLYNKDYNVIINNKIKKDPFIKLNAKSFNSISECIGVILDNAIEASEETMKPIIIMDLYEDKENIYIKVGNNFSNNLDFEKLGNKYYSTKNRGSGLGLFSIFRNNLINEQISIINDMYYIELQMKKAQ